MHSALLIIVIPVLHILLVWFRPTCYIKCNQKIRILFSGWVVSYDSIVFGQPIICLKDGWVDAVNGSLAKFGDLNYFS